MVLHFVEDKEGFNMILWLISRSIALLILRFLLDLTVMGLAVLALSLLQLFGLGEKAQKETVLNKAGGYALVALIAAVPALIIAAMVNESLYSWKWSELALRFVIGPLFVIESLWFKPKDYEELRTKIIGTTFGIIIYLFAALNTETIFWPFSWIGEWLAYK